MIKDLEEELQNVLKDLPDKEGGRKLRQKLHKLQNTGKSASKMPDPAYDHYGISQSIYTQNEIKEKKGIIKFLKKVLMKIPNGLLNLLEELGDILDPTDILEGGAMDRT